MGLLEDYSIHGKIEGKPYAHAAGIFIAYPSREDWRKLYKPQALRMPDENGIYHNVNAFEERYQDMKHDHEKNVAKMLDRIRHWDAGRAVFAETKAHQSYTVNIFPFDFLPSRQWSLDTLAVTESVRVPQTTREQAHDRKPLGTSICSHGMCYAKGTASAVDLFFTARRDDAKDADSTLLHELLHATRFQQGLINMAPVSGTYKNQEEFLANVVEMIYRSEKGRPVYDYDYAPIRASTFLDRNMHPTPRHLLKMLRRQQRKLFDALVDVDADFNPIKQLDDELDA